MSDLSWQQKAADKRASVVAKIPQEWLLSTDDVQKAAKERNVTGSFIQQFLTPQEVIITSLDSVPIVEAIKCGKFSALEVTRAFCKTAAVAQQIGNCLHEIFFDQALDRAKQLDDYFEQHGKTIGPLHGLPFSLKDQFHVKGVDTTMGYVGWIGKNLGVSDPTKHHKVESQLTSELLSLGAILYCKTSVPQTLLFGETKNNIWGYTPNPQNKFLSSGGSSGGEGALQALRGSTLGLGTDIGGSVRIPAAFNGIFGLKPTPERISYRDAANTAPGQNTYRSTVGILSTSIDGLELGLRSILSTKPWLRDPAVVPIPFRQDVVDSYLERGHSGANNGTKPLKLGIFWNDGVVTPHPPVTRGLSMVVDAVRRVGHKVVEWKPPSHAEGVEIHRRFLYADGADDVSKHLALSGEPLVADLEATLSPQDPNSLLDYQDYTVRGLEYEARYADYWNSTADEDGQIVDALIVPVAPHAAVIPGKYYHVAYTEIFNMLNYSSVVIPVTKANKTIDVVDEAYEPLNDLDKQNWEAYDLDVYDGGPVAVQIVGRKFEEEKAWAIAKLVLAALHK